MKFNLVDDEFYLSDLEKLLQAYDLKIQDANFLSKSPFLEVFHPSPSFLYSKLLQIREERGVNEVEVDVIDIQFFQDFAKVDLDIATSDAESSVCLECYETSSCFSPDRGICNLH